MTRKGGRVERAGDVRRQRKNGEVLGACAKQNCRSGFTPREEERSEIGPRSTRPGLVPCDGRDEPWAHSNAQQDNLPLTPLFNRRRTEVTEFNQNHEARRMEDRPAFL